MSRRFSLLLIVVGLLLFGCAEEEAGQLAPRGVSALERLDEVLAAAGELLPTARLFEISGSTVEVQTFGGLCTNWSYRFYSAEDHQLLDLTLSRDGLITPGEPEPAPADFSVIPLEQESLSDSSAVLALLRDSAEIGFFEGAEPLSESYYLDGSSSNWLVSLTASGNSDNGEQLTMLTAVVSLEGEILEMREGEL